MEAHESGTPCFFVLIPILSTTVLNDNVEALIH